MSAEAGVYVVGTPSGRIKIGVAKDVCYRDAYKQICAVLAQEVIG